MKKILISFLVLFSFSVQADFLTGKKYFDEGNYSAAFNAFISDADAGDKRAQYYVGYFYLKGYGIKQDPSMALKYLNDSAKNGYTSAQTQLAYLYSEGKFVPLDKKKAIELYTIAADQQDPSAMFNLGLAYYNGDGVAKDVQRAIDLLKGVPDDNQPCVGYYLGEFYMNSSDSDKVRKAQKEYIRSARLGCKDSFYALGGIYEDGDNLEQAVKYYTYAAANNHVLAQYTLAIMYIDGIGLKKDLIRGYAWLEMAANQGDEPAQEELNKLNKIFSISQKEMARVEFNRIQRTIINNVEVPVIDGDLPGATGKKKQRPNRHRRR